MDFSHLLSINTKFISIRQLPFNLNKIANLIVIYCRSHRGNARSLWMGVLWALTSGSGVAVALLQGSAGPLIGVAISASLLPPVVNCVSKLIRVEDL